MSPLVKVSKYRLTLNPHSLRHNVYSILEANPVGVTLMSERSVQLDRSRSRSEGNIGEEINDGRPILSYVTDVWSNR